MGVGITKTTYLNKIKILVMNSITFKIPILTATIQYLKNLAGVDHC